MSVTQQILKLRILPRWIIIIIDIGLVAMSTILGYLLRFNFDLIALLRHEFFYGVSINSFSVLISVVLTKSYAGIVRYTGIGDGVRLLKTLLISLLIVSVINLLHFANFGKNLIPYSVILISFLAAFLFLFQYRLLIKNIFSYYSRNITNKAKVAIFGAGRLGMMTKQLMEGDDQSNFRVLAFFEDDARKQGKVIDGTAIFNSANLEYYLKDLDIEKLVITDQGISFERKNEIVDICLKEDVKVLSIPNVKDWVHGELSLKQIKEVKIEELLGRESIQLDNLAIRDVLNGKRVCITGAAGSIGSELARQAIQYKPSTLILIDQAESPLYELQRELDSNASCTMYVGDITDRKRIESIFKKETPEVIFHAAAYKHVPLMESNAVEAVTTNVLGTKNLADLAVEFKVERFVMISTDKAVNPTSVMGCSKRIAEIYVQSLNNELKDKIGSTTFVTTRFGNVLGSNGSVIPFFKRQISKGGPITVTHPEITRYFMTITEACQLVLEAGAMGKGGEIFIFDMGKSMRIVDLARKMVRLSGLELGRDIEIVFTGLRQGEKLFEELLLDKENTIPTHHHKIMIAQVSEYSFEEVNKSLENLERATNDYEHSSSYEIVALMKAIVPEFKSNSSIFEVLDTSKKAL